VFAQKCHNFQEVQNATGGSKMRALPSGVMAVPVLLGLSAHGDRPLIATAMTPPATTIERIDAVRFRLLRGSVENTDHILKCPTPDVMLGQWRN
jgi:hypothetical protein